MRHAPLLFALLMTTAAVAEPPARSTVSPTRSHSLETELLRAVRDVGFDQVLDWRHKGRRVDHMPNVDVAVIELDAEGRPLAAANVLVSRDYPQGQVVPIDPETLGTKDVRFTRWDLDRWDDRKSWDDVTSEDDIVPGREKAPLRFMAPYPASLFKILIAYGVMRRVDRGELSLEETYRERPLRGWLEPMIVESSNTATEALVRLLHSRGTMEGVNAEFADLGLGTLQVNGTSPVTGRNWQPGSIHMTALDTARLFLLINGGPGVLWRTPEGRPVTAGELSEPARDFLKKLLADQGYTEGLSSTLLCGDKNAKPGIPTAVPARWLAADGTATVGETSFRRDTRPCNAAAEVEFLHKTGQTENYGSDAGIVHSLPGKAPRHYVIALLSNLGRRYYDESLASTANFADEDSGLPGMVTAIRYTQSIAELGHRIDEAMKQRAR